MPSDPRIAITFRLGLVGKDWIDYLAHTHRVDRSEVIRAALAVAKKHESELISRLEERS
jgi:hypothetical protein